MKANELDWLFDLKAKVPQFLNRLKGESVPGFFGYSLTGDRYDEKIGWGLGNTVFAAKIYYTLSLLNLLSKVKRDEMVNFIKGFQQSDGSICDPLVSGNISLNTRLQAVKNFNFSNFRGQQTKRAETRQSFSALRLLKARPDLPYLNIPYTRDGIKKYLADLDWEKPYGAGSHFSHLVFFLHLNREMFSVATESADDLIDYAISWVNDFQSARDGSWYLGESIMPTQKINGAMKVITGLKAVGKPNFRYPEKLIDLCLSGTTFNQACNNLDAIYVVNSANELTRGSHRLKEIQDFGYRWLAICRGHYFADIGGFSFFKHKANQYYYGAKITAGRDEPDIHGTVLLLWGIALAAKILGIEKELGFREFIT